MLKNKDEVLYLLKQNRLSFIEWLNEDIVIVNCHGYRYKVYTSVMCHCCGAPLMAIDSEVYNSTSCTNKFCKQCTY